MLCNDIVYVFESMAKCLLKRGVGLWEVAVFVWVCLQEASAGLLEVSILKWRFDCSIIHVHYTSWTQLILTSVGYMYF